MGRAKSAKKLEPIAVRLDPDVRAGIEALAKADERSLSDYINRALRRHLEAERAAQPEAKGPAKR
jgi:predicted transcriptional regulator